MSAPSPCTAGLIVFAVDLRRRPAFPEASCKDGVPAPNVIFSVAFYAAEIFSLDAGNIGHDESKTSFFIDVDENCIRSPHRP